MPNEKRDDNIKMKIIKCSDINNADTESMEITFGEPLGANSFNGLQMQLTDAAGIRISSGFPVVFNKIINNQSCYIDYSEGIYTINSIGNFYVSWWVATSDAGESESVTFELNLNGCKGIPASSPSAKGQLSGNALISASEAPFTVSLINVTGESVKTASAPVQANITIVKYPC